MLKNRVQEKVVNFIDNIKYRSVPPEAIDIAQKAICDCIGVCVAGADQPAARILIEHVKEMKASGEAGVIAGGFKTCAEMAAWINGTMSHSLDYDDASPQSTGYNFHPTVAILPAILALGERCDASGEDILTAYICGAEIEYSLGAAIGKLCSEMGWHPTGILGIMGAAGASAKILKLNKSQSEMAFGIASSLSGGLMRNAGSMTKPMHAGNASRNGVLAALLSKRGFTSKGNMLGTRLGFIDIFSGKQGFGAIEELKGLGHEWEIASKGVSFKPYPCCRGAHSSIDAALFLREKYKLRVEEIKTVVCKTSPMIPQLLSYHRPKTGSEGKFSLEYCVASSLLRGKPNLEHFTDEKVNDPRVQNLISDVCYSHPENWPTGTDLTQEVVLKLKSGKEYSYKVTLPKGEPENPMTSDELMEKFLNCAESFLDTREAEYLLQALSDLSSVDSIRILMDMLTSVNIERLP